MSKVTIQVWELCPFRSPVVPREPSALAGTASPAPLQALGPCLQAGCGLWKVTKIIEGRPAEGMCSLRYAAECQAETAGALQHLAKELSGCLAILTPKAQG